LSTARTRGPRPFSQKVLKTLFVRVPSADWPAVRTGYKRVFRGSPGRQSWLEQAETPTPVVAYCVRPGREYEHKLMVLEDLRHEALGAITPEGLAEEGFTGELAFEEFRRYWIEREKRRFAPLTKVAVYKVRLWTPDDEQALGAALLQRMYGSFEP
jgi:hypothetical protein